MEKLNVTVEIAKPIGQLTPDEFRRAIRLVTIIDGKRTEYVVTSIGRIGYAVELTSGQSFTRPQLVEFGQKRGASYVITL